MTGWNSPWQSGGTVAAENRLKIALWRNSSWKYNSHTQW
jgi:hypothetical protein